MLCLATRERNKSEFYWSVRFHTLSLQEVAVKETFTQTKQNVEYLQDPFTKFNKLTLYYIFVFNIRLEDEIRGRGCCFCSTVQSDVVLKTLHPLIRALT